MVYENKKHKKDFELPKSLEISLGDLDENTANRVGELIADYLAGKYHVNPESFSFNDIITVDEISWETDN